MFIGTFFEKVKIALQSQVCLYCEQKLGASSQFCHRCHEKLGIRQPKPVLDTPYCTLHAATNLNPNVKRLVYGHKFHNRIEHVSELAGLLIQYWDKLSASKGNKSVHPENVLVIPIPPHAGEQSLIEVFASRFARHFGYDYRPDVLTWMRDVKPQHRIHDKNQRVENIAQSMYMKTGIVSGYEQVIIIDDITTTGSTLMEACRAFRAESANSTRQTSAVCLAVAKVPMGAQIRTCELD